MSPRAILGLAAGAALLACAACNTTTPAARYASATGYDSGADFRALVRVGATAAASTPAAGASPAAAPSASAGGPITVKDLPERAAAAYITALAARTKTVADLQAALAKPIGGGASATPKSTTNLSRTLLVSVSEDCGPALADCVNAPRRQFPGDRMTYVEIWIHPNGFVFTDIPAAATTWATQLIDTRDVSSDLKLQPELDATLAGTVKGAFKGPVSYDHSVDVKGTDSEPYRLPTISIQGGDIVLEASGARGVDLAGTATVKATLAPTPGDETRTRAYFVASDIAVGSVGAWLAAAKSKVTLTRVQAWKPVTLTADVTYWYGVRHIVSGRNTYFEDDDTVQYIDSGPIRACAVIAAPQDTAYPVWEIIGPGDRPVGVQTNSGADFPVYFTSLDDAELFAGWLGAIRPKEIGKQAIGYFDGSSLSPVQARDPLEVWSATKPVDETVRPGDACTPLAAAAAK